MQLKKNKNDYDEDDFEEQLRKTKGPHFLLVGGGTASGI